MSEVQVAAQDTPQAAPTEKAGESLLNSEAVAPPAENPSAATPNEVEAKPEVKNAGEKDSEGEASAQAIELAKPEEFYLDDSAVESIVAMAKERGLSKEQAQEILDQQNEAVKKYVEQTNERVREVSESWKTLTLKDKEIGGEGFKEKIQVAHEAVKKFASEDFIKALNETGFGNHPEVVRVFYRIGLAMREDKLVVPGAQGPRRPQDIASRLYGNNNQ